MDKYVKEYFGDLVMRARDHNNDLDFFSQHKLRGRMIYNQIALPVSRLELWRHTEIEKKLENILGDITDNTARESKFSYFSFWENCYRIITCNGIFQKEESSKRFPEGIVVCSFKEALEAGYLIFSEKYETLTDPNDHFTAINSAVTDDGLFIHIPADLKMDKPIHIVHRTVGKGLISSRILIDIEDGSQCSMLESFQSEKQNNFINNVVSEIYVGSSAVFNHYCIHMNSGRGMAYQSMNVRQCKDSSYHSFSMTLPGCDFTRNNIHVQLCGENACNYLSGLFFGADRFCIDNHTLVEHNVSNCKSDENYRGILQDFSTGIFNGKVIVHPQAQKTVAYQQNKNLILSDDAHMYTNPQLEIFADDVICTHGATIGELHRPSLFYLQSRGIKEETALGLLTQAFIFDVIDRVSDKAIREYIRELAAANLSDLHRRN